MDINRRAEYLAGSYADAILRLSYTYLKNNHDAQDVCQTVFVRLLTAPGTLKAPPMSGPTFCGWRLTPARTS